MADAAIFIGWGTPVRGREARAVQVFNESVQYWTGLEEQGQIESFEVVLLEAHGGDLNGFALLRGSREQLAQVRYSEEFLRHVARAQLIVENLGVVNGALGQNLSDQMALYQSQVADLT
jgi:hypothetical protein